MKDSISRTLRNTLRFVNRHPFQFLFFLVTGLGFGLWFQNLADGWLVFVVWFLLSLVLLTIGLWKYIDRVSYIFYWLVAGLVLWFVSIGGNVVVGILTNSILESESPANIQIFLAERLPAILLFNVLQIWLLTGLVLFGVYWWKRMRSEMPQPARESLPIEKSLPGKTKSLPKQKLPLHHYLIWCLFGWLVIGLIAVPLIAFFAQNLSLAFLDPLSLLAVWTVVMLVIFVWLGAEGEWYNSYVKPHRGIWISFFATFLLAFILLNYTYNYINQRLLAMMSARQAMLGQLYDADAALAVVSTQSQQLHGLINPLISNSGFVDSAAQNNVAMLFQETPNPTSTPEIRGEPERKRRSDEVSQQADRLINQHTKAIRSQMQAAERAVQKASVLLEQAIAQERDLYNSIDPNPSATPTQAITTSLDISGTLNVPLSVEPSASPEAAAPSPTPTPDHNAEAIARVRQANSLVWLRPVMETTNDTVSELVSDHKALLDQLEAWNPQPDEEQAYSQLFHLANRVENELIPSAQRARNRTGAVLAAANGLELVFSPLIIANLILLFLFTILPWFLLLLFFFRKRDNLATGIVKDLLRLAPSRSLLKRVLDLTDVQVPEPDQTSKARKKLWDVPYVESNDFASLRVEPEDEAPATGANEKQSDSKPKMVVDRKVAEQVELLKSVRALPTVMGDAIHADKWETGITAFNRVRDALAGRIFSNFEYVLTLTALTAILGVGWYLVFFPNTSSGLAVLILQSSGILGYAKYLLEGLTPITAGFIGAYLWVAHMLLRRYFYGDLYPSAFLQGILRFLTVFILSVLLSFIPTLSQGSAGAANSTSGQVVQGVTALLPATNLVQVAGTIGEFLSQNALILVAFMVGIFPIQGLRYLTEVANKIGHESFPDMFAKAPLVKLDGLDSFIESRMLEENVENIQALATAQIQELVVNTYFPASQIVDWMDQAILYQHCGNEGQTRFEQFRQAGIRNATDFLDRLGFDLGVPLDHEKYELAFPPDVLQRCKTLAETIRSANQKADAIAARCDASVLEAANLYAESLLLIQANTRELEQLKNAIPLELPKEVEPLNKNIERVKKIGARRVELVEALIAFQTDLKKELEGWTQVDARQDILKELASVQTDADTVKASAEKLKPLLDAVKAEDATTLGKDATWRETITTVQTESKALFEKGDHIHDEILKHYPEPPMTAQLLDTIADVIVPDQNLIFVLNWYAWYKESSARNKNSSDKAASLQAASQKLKGNADKNAFGFGFGIELHLPK